MKGAGYIIAGVLATLCVLAPAVMAGGFGVGSGGLQASGGSAAIGTGSTLGPGCVTTATGLNCVGVDAGALNVQAKAAASYFVSTLSTGTVANGGANFSCPNNPGVSSPCLANPSKPLELGGFHAVSPQDFASDVYIGCMEHKDGGACLEVLNNYGAPGGGAEITLARVTYDGDLRLKHWIYLNEEAGTDGRILTTGSLYNMSTNTIIMWNQGSQAVSTWFSGAGATQVMQLTAAGAVVLTDGPSRGACTLDGASPSKCTATVASGARCVCSGSGTTAATAVACATSVTTTTLTITAANGLTSAVNFLCL